LFCSGCHKIICKRHGELDEKRKNDEYEPNIGDGSIRFGFCIENNCKKNNQNKIIEKETSSSTVEVEAEVAKVTTTIVVEPINEIPEPSSTKTLAVPEKEVSSVPILSEQSLSCPTSPSHHHHHQNNTLIHSLNDLHHPEIYFNHPLLVSSNQGLPWNIWIGPGSEWSSPFFPGFNGTSEECRQGYIQYLTEERHDLINRIHELKGKVLGCDCNSNHCHGQFLVFLANTPIRNSSYIIQNQY